MGITVRWDDEVSGCVVMSCDREWDWVALRQAALDVIAMETRSGRLADVIVDLRQGAPRFRLDDMGHVHRLLTMCPEGNQGPIVLVTRDPRIGAVVRVARRTFARLSGRLLVAETLEEARQKIVQRRA